MNRLTLIDRCTRRFRDPSHKAVTTLDWIDYLNDAYMDVVSYRSDWPFLDNRATVTLAPGEGEALLPENAFAVTAVHNTTDHFPLSPIDGTVAYRHMFPDPANSLGTPQVYRVRRNKLEVFPRPSVQTRLEIDVELPVPELLADTDEPVFPEQFHRLLVSGALSLAYADQGNLEHMQVHNQIFQAGVQRMAVDLLGTRTEQYVVPTDVW